MTMTVTASVTNDSFGGGLLQVQVLNNAALAGTPATVTSGAAFNASLTTTVAGSLVFGAVNNQTASTTFAAEPLCTIISQSSINGGGAQGAAFKTTSVTGTPGSTLVGSSTTFPGNFGMCAVEIVPAGAGNVTIDGSSPVVVDSVTLTSLTSAAFQPSSGALVAAILSFTGNGTAATPVATVSGGGLTWTKQVEFTTGGAGYVGVWTAQAPIIPSAPVLPYRGGTIHRLKVQLRYQAIFPPPPALQIALADGGTGADVMFNGNIALNDGGTGADVLTYSRTMALPDAGTGTDAFGLAFITGMSGSTSADYFQDQLARPTWMFCDAVWTIVYSAGRVGGANTYQTDMTTWLSTRAAQGYTALECNLLPNNEYIASGLTSEDGFHPFNTGVDPVSGFNNNYWRRLDFLVATAAQYGITCFLNLLMGEDLASGVAGAWTTTQLTSFGNQVATRYLNSPNVIWMINDDDGAGISALQNILLGVRNAGDTRPISAEGETETTTRVIMKTLAAADMAALPPNYQWVYSYNVAYLGVEIAYSETSPILVLRGDGLYFGSGLPSGKEDLTMRNHLWWSISSGSRGFSGGVSDGGWGAFATGWQANLTLAGEETGTPGAYQVSVFPAVTAFLKNLPGWQKLAPDPSNAFITAGRGTKATPFTAGLGSTGAYDAGGGTPDTYISGSIASDGSIALIYFSPGSSGTITINQTLMVSGYTATWVDPCNCATSSITAAGTYLKKAAANSAGDHDWVLLLQAPGSGSTGTASAVGAGVATAVATQIAPATAAGAGAVTAVATVIATATAAAAGVVTAKATEVPATATVTGAGAVTAVATQVAPASAAGAGAVTDVATQVVTASAAGAGAAAATAIQAAVASAAAAGSVADVVTQVAGAAAAGAGSVTAAASGGGSSTGSAAGAGAVADVVTQIAPATAAGAGAVAAVATQVAGGAAAAAGSTGTVSVTQAATAVAAAAGAVADVVTQIATASAAGAAAVTAAGSGTGGGTAFAAGAGAVTAVVTQAVTGVAAAAAAVADVATQVAKATAAGAGSASASGAITGTASAAGAGAATAKATQAAVASPAGAAVLTALATQAATAALAGAGAATAAGGIQLAFTVGTLTAADKPAAVLAGAVSAGSATAGTLTASDQRTGGPA